jgi:hypothetical protein
MIQSQPKISLKTAPKIFSQNSIKEKCDLGLPAGETVGKGRHPDHVVSKLKYMGIYHTKILIFRGTLDLHSCLNLKIQAPTWIAL